MITIRDSLGNWNFTRSWTFSKVYSLASRCLFFTRDLHVLTCGEVTNWSVNHNNFSISLISVCVSLNLKILWQIIFNPFLQKLQQKDQRIVVVGLLFLSFIFNPWSHNRLVCNAFSFTFSMSWCFRVFFSVPVSLDFFRIFSLRPKYLHPFALPSPTHSRWVPD